MVRYIPQKLAGIYHRYGLMSRVFPATLTILCLIRTIGYVGYSAPCFICAGGMIAAPVIIASPIRPTFNIIEREPVFVNPFITLISKFSQSPPLEFAIHNIVDTRVVVDAPAPAVQGTRGQDGVLHLPIHHPPSKNSRLHPILPHLLLWHTQNIFA